MTQSTSPARVLVLSVALATLAACGIATPPPDTAVAPDGAFGSNGDNDLAAINLASWAFSASRNTRDRPVEGARSVAAIDYLAGQINSGGRWVGLSPIVQMQMLQARQQVRAAVGIAPNAPSQHVVTRLAQYAAALSTGADQASAGQYLTDPAFTLGPQGTETRLAALPFLSETNVATQRAAAAMIGDGSRGRFGGG